MRHGSCRLHRNSGHLLHRFFDWELVGCDLGRFGRADSSRTTDMIYLKANENLTLEPDVPKNQVYLGFTRDGEYIVSYEAVMGDLHPCFLFYSYGEGEEAFNTPVECEFFKLLHIWKWKRVEERPSRVRLIHCVSFPLFAVAKLGIDLRSNYVHTVFRLLKLNEEKNLCVTCFETGLICKRHEEKLQVEPEADPQKMAVGSLFIVASYASPMQSITEDDQFKETEPIPLKITVAHIHLAHEHDIGIMTAGTDSFSSLCHQSHIHMSLYTRAVPAPFDPAINYYGEYNSIVINTGSSLMMARIIVSLECYSSLYEEGPRGKEVRGNWKKRKFTCECIEMLACKNSHIRADVYFFEFERWIFTKVEDGLGRLKRNAVLVNYEVDLLPRRCAPTGTVLCFASIIFSGVDKQKYPNEYPDEALWKVGMWLTIGLDDGKVEIIYIGLPSLVNPVGRFYNLASEIKANQTEIQRFLFQSGELREDLVSFDRFLTNLPWIRGKSLSHLKHPFLCLSISKPGIE
ncbi:uncharacterized protein LOC126316709 [Schistocerca gregaria]|uniref:uncharacterized protein LOC126316709 n=1 Tax=Schistocerca gregaria TaxID=7010 RepID=UPI00211EA07B|nr:uncharacterized protein LOC126316709 [Schistocerca gregaria]